MGLLEIPKVGHKHMSELSSPRLTKWFVYRTGSKLEEDDSKTKTRRLLST